MNLQEIMNPDTVELAKIFNNSCKLTGTNGSYCLWNEP